LIDGIISTSGNGNKLYRFLIKRKKMRIKKEGEEVEKEK